MLTQRRGDAKRNARTSNFASWRFGVWQMGLWQSVWRSFGEVWLVWTAYPIGVCALGRLKGPYCGSRSLTAELTRFCFPAQTCLDSRVIYDEF
ncbi:hypothetical protein SAMN06265222_12083 [Neorhodopirellula lusitana]|uniref:Uncharacterized protein n=1 Tax=Neorhodopirellula lusitana TaxID=445327 RepID=A0ABY1QP73_9BACT|nr:hypothetical protein SAMN06265222_12083 [Neorhodopirellula lusitana]